MSTWPFLCSIRSVKKGSERCNDNAETIYQAAHGKNPGEQLCNDINSANQLLT